MSVSASHSVLTPSHETDSLPDLTMRWWFLLLTNKVMVHNVHDVRRVGKVWKSHRKRGSFGSNTVSVISIIA